MTPVRLALIASAAALAIALFALWPDRAAPLAVQAPKLPAPSQPPTVIPVPAAVPRADPSERMRQLFEKTDNYAAFIHDAMQRPGEGGLFYATLAFHRCQRVAQPVTAGAAWTGDSAVRAAAVQTWDSMRQRCAGVAGQFPDEGGFMRAVRLASARGAADVLAPQGMVRMAPSEDDARRAYARAKSLGDPYLMGLTLEADARYLAGGIDPAYANGANDEVFRYATSAAVCELLDGCAGSVQSAEPCVLFGRCVHADYRDYLGDGLDPESLALFNRTRKKLVQSGRSAK